MCSRAGAEGVDLVPEKQNLVAFPRSARKRKQLLLAAESLKLRRLTRLRSLTGWLLAVSILLFTAVHFTLFTPASIVQNFRIVRTALTGSDGVLRGAPGGHPDTAAGSKCCIIVTPLIRGRMATVCEKVVTVTTPGDCVDVLVTDYGIAVNPLRPDLMECLDNAGIPHVTIESLKEKAYSLVGRPDDLEWEDKVVAVLEARDGTILDVVRKIKPLEL